MGQCPAPWHLTSDMPSFVPCTQATQATLAALNLVPPSWIWVRLRASGINGLPCRQEPCWPQGKIWAPGETSPHGHLSFFSFLCFLHGRIRNPACKDPYTSQGLQGQRQDPRHAAGCTATMCKSKPLTVGTVHRHAAQSIFDLVAPRASLAQDPGHLQSLVPIAPTLRSHPNNLSQDAHWPPSVTS